MSEDTPVASAPQPAPEPSPRDEVARDAGGAAARMPAGGPARPDELPTAVILPGPGEPPTAVIRSVEPPTTIINPVEPPTTVIKPAEPPTAIFTLPSQAVPYLEPPTVPITGLPARPATPPASRLPQPHGGPTQPAGPAKPTGPARAAGPAVPAGPPRAVGSAPAGPPRPSAPTGPPKPPVKPPTPSAPDDDLDPTIALERKRKRSRLRTTILFIVAISIMTTGVGLAGGTYYVDSVTTPDQLPLPEATTVYYADGKTPMAKLGAQNRTILKFDEMNDAVKEAIVAAEDRSFWTNAGIDFKGVVRAAWNNATGGATQGASTITQQYARQVAELTGVTYSRKLREAVIAYKLTKKYTKPQILEFYLDTVPFGRGTYGIEAAAQVFMGKTANKNAPAAQQLTLADAMVLAAMVKQPERDPDNPEALPGYDPTRNATALQNSKGRFAYIKSQLVPYGSISPAQITAVTYPTGIVKPFNAEDVANGLTLPTGIVVSHVMSELRQTDKFRDSPIDAIANGGYRIITTINPAAQTAAQEAADIRGAKAPAAVRGQPDNWQAALVAVEPGTGRVLAYYGGPSGVGADYAGWYVDEQGDAKGFGQHPPGSSFKVYDLIEALRQGYTMDSVWDSPPSKEFPKSARTKKFPAGPVRNASTAPCQPNCTLTQATVASLNVPFFDLTEHLGVDKVLESAARAGIDDMWANVPGNPVPQRIDLRGKSGADLAPHFSTEVGIGQYGITVADQANGFATIAAGGKRAQLHFVEKVTKADDTVYQETITQTDVGLTPEQSIALNDTLSQVPASQLDNGWDTGGKTGTWQYGTSTSENAHTWMCGYSEAIAAAVWVGTTDGAPLISKNGTPVAGSTIPGPIWQQFMKQALATMGLDDAKRKFPTPSPTPTPTETPSPTPTATEVTPSDTGSPTGTPDDTATVGPTGGPTIIGTPPVVTPSLPAITSPPPAATAG